MRFLPAGPAAFLVELDDLDAVLGLFAALRDDPVDGVADLVPAARTLLVRAAPGVAADARLAGQVARRIGRVRPADSPLAPVIEVPVAYDGPDLADVAAHMGLTPAQVIAAHQAALWTVAFCGFAPGFAYMTCDDPRFDLPRRPSPRVAVPAGSVALAGRFGGIYPNDSPGGWQLIGTTALPMWDLDRNPPALLQPGDRVRFVEAPPELRRSAARRTKAEGQGLRVITTAFPVLVQDMGRAGQAAQGISASGALDRGALIRANLRLGNPADTPVLEITLGPTRLSPDMPVTLALEGAAQNVWIETASGKVPVDVTRAFAMDAGEVLVIAPPDQGVRSYLALRGGFAVPKVLRSAATDTLSGVGPAPLLAGDGLAAAGLRAGSVDPHPATPCRLPAPGEVVVLPVTLGPRADWFPPDMVALFLAQEWVVTPQSSRIGLRLEGPHPLRRTDARELPSEGTQPGALQVPHSGQPVLFLADHPLTGGYPVIATLDPAALDLAGQLPPGSRLRFAAAAPFAAILPEMP